MNVAILTGRLTKDVELKATANNVSVTSFTVAVDRKYKREGENNTDFISVVAYGKTAEFIANYFKKGQKIEVTGRMQTRTYEKDGVRHYVTEVIAETVDFGESKRAETGAIAVSPEADINTFIPIDDDDLPF